MSIVNLTMEGFLAKDPEVKISAAGKPMAKISVAHNPGKKEDNKPPIWFNLTCVGQAGADIQYAKKGDKVKVVRATPEEWTDNNGNKRLNWTVFQVETEAKEPRQEVPPQGNDSPPFPEDSDIPF